MDIEIDTILVPVDGTPAASRAVEYAVTVAAVYDADIHVLHLVDEEDRQTAADADVAEDHRTFLADVTAGLAPVDDGTVGVTASAAAGFSEQSLSTHPVSVVLETASEVAADMIVVPRESVREDPTALLAKAAEHVLSYASQPVLSV